MKIMCFLMENWIFESCVHFPDWDMQIIQEIGFEKCQYDTTVGERVMKDWDLKEAPLFGIYAWKREHDENRRICEKTSCDD